MGITYAILKQLETSLTDALITSIPENDPTRAGAVKIGPLQGDPDVDAARISVEIYANDPTGTNDWEDEIVEWEMPRTAIWARRFTILWRALLVDTGEDLDEAARIASTIKSRIEFCINRINWSGLEEDGETVIGCADDMLSVYTQGGGPDEYDYSGYINFDIETRQPYRR